VIVSAALVVSEDSGPQTFTGIATNISPGPGANEAGQTVHFNVSADNTALFSAQPAIDASGTLTFTPAPNMSGSAMVSVAAQDDGGVANGGVDTSPTQTFTITVTFVNDAPSFTSGGNVTVNEDSGAYNQGWATAISPGAGVNEAGQVVHFNVSNNNNPLFSVQPAVDGTTGTLTFTPAANMSGTALVSVAAQDNGGVANGGVDTSPTMRRASPSRPMGIC
jgi:hypothetical protein